MRRKFWWFIAASTVTWLLWMTMRPNPEVSQELQPLTDPVDEETISPGVLINVLGNVVVFTPLGGSIALALDPDRKALPLRWGIAVGAGALLSAIIELTQLTLPSRVTSFQDWLLNTLGAALGAGMALGAQRLLERRKKSEF
jgi:glycopeptide antibiotics resistance protein